MAPPMLLLAVSVAVSIGSLIVSAHNGVVHMTWVVGDDHGWTTPASIPGGYNYTAWAAKNAIKKSDKLTFVYEPKTQDILQVTAANYADCTYANPIFNDLGAGTFNYSIKEAGDYYFVCSVEDRCKSGMKFHFTTLLTVEHEPAPAPASGSSSLGIPAVAAVVATFSLAAHFLL